MREESVPLLNENGKSHRMEWILDTEGINLLAVLSQPQVDHRRTKSTSIVEVGVLDLLLFQSRHYLFKPCCGFFFSLLNI